MPTSCGRATVDYSIHLSHWKHCIQLVALHVRYRYLLTRFRSGKNCARRKSYGDIWYVRRADGEQSDWVIASDVCGPAYEEPIQSTIDNATNALRARWYTLRRSLAPTLVSSKQQRPRHKTFVRLDLRPQLNGKRLPPIRPWLA